MTELITLGFTIIKEFFAGYQKMQKAKQDRELAAMENQARLLRDTQAANSAWEMAALKESDRYLRRTSFFLFSLPMVLAIFDPQGVDHYFKVTMAGMPDWYIKTFMGINGSIWGIASLKNAIPAMINQVKSWKNPDTN